MKFVGVGCVFKDLLGSGGGPRALEGRLLNPGCGRLLRRDP